MTTSLDMSPHWPQVDDRVRDFHSHVNNIKLDGRHLVRDPQTRCVRFEPCTFIPFDRVEAYFSDRERIKLLLKSIYGQEKVVPDPKTIFSYSLKIFCILLLINRGHLIKHLISNDIDDTRLPFRAQPEDLKYLDALEPEFWTEFSREQWRFFPHKFELEQINMKVADAKILPIYRSERIEESDGRTVYKIMVHGEYHSLREKGSGLSAHQEEDRNTFVLKSLDSVDGENLERYESEIAAFHRLGCNGVPGALREPPAEIIRCYGSFKQNSIYHILLEHADKGTLEDYFRQTSQPTTLKDLIDFWESLKAVVVGVARIHNVLTGGERSIGVFQGYHQDLKLSNILVFTEDPVSRYKMRFKIADLGLTNFVENPFYLMKALGEGKAGTRTFGSPESHQARYYSSGEFISGQPDDIWSLACIFSISATWIVGGWLHVRQYENRRREARKALGKHGDCFHDDHYVLQEVRQWHTMLANERARYDYIMPRIWECLLVSAFCSEAQTDTSRSIAIKFQTDVTDLKKQPSPESSTYVPEPIKKVKTSPMVSDHTPSQPRGTTYGPRRTQTDVTPGKRPERRERGVVRSSLELGPINDEEEYQPWTSESDNLTHSPTSTNTESRAAYDDSPRSVFDEARHEQSRQSTSRTQQSKRASRSESGKTLEHDQRRSFRSSQERHPSKELSRLSIPSSKDDEDALSSNTSHNTHLASDQCEEKGKAAADNHNPHCPAHPNNKQKMDYMSVTTLLDWKEARDRRNVLEGRDSFDKIIPHSALKNYLVNRDHVFVFEDSKQMKPHWRSVCSLFGAIAKFIKSCDSDGLEVHFTVSADHIRSTKSKPLIDSVMAHGNKLNASSQPVTTLERVWAEHRDSVREDGKWQPGTDKHMEEFLHDVVEFLKKHECERGQVGIQFIQFGKGQMETDRLDYFDKDLKEKLGKDIVDRESSDGNVWKMLLGSVLPGFDDDEVGEMCICRRSTEPHYV